MTLALVTVTGTLRAPDTLTPLQGTVTFTPGGGVLVDPVTKRILAGPVTVPLDATGSFSIALPPTDQAGIQPAANTWNWGAVFKLARAVLAPFNFALLTGSGPVDLSTVIQVAALPGTYLVVPGPAGTNGTNGHTPQLYGGAAAPSTLHTDGDLYLRTNGDLYQQTAGAWGSPVGNIQGPPGTGGGGVAPPLMRSVRIVSDNNSGLPAAPTWSVVVTSGRGALPAEPIQVTIPAAAGNRIRLIGSFMRSGSHFLDWVILNADGSISQYATQLGSDHPTQAPAEGNPSLYPSLSQAYSTGEPVFTVGAGHISSGHVTLGLAHQGTGAGVVYAYEDTSTHVAYPVALRAENVDQTEPAP